MKKSKLSSLPLLEMTNGELFKGTASFKALTGRSRRIIEKLLRKLETDF